MFCTEPIPAYKWAEKLSWILPSASHTRKFGEMIRTWHYFHRKLGHFGKLSFLFRTRIKVLEIFYQKRIPKDAFQEEQNYFLKWSTGCDTYCRPVALTQLWKTSQAAPKTLSPGAPAPTGAPLAGCTQEHPWHGTAGPRDWAAPQEALKSFVLNVQKSEWPSLQLCLPS